MVGWDNRPYLAAGFEASKESLLGYSFRFRDRCRSGLSGTPGKRVLVKANRGFESLPVRTNVRTGSPNQRDATNGWRGGGFEGRAIPTVIRMGLGKEGAHCAGAEAHNPTTPEG